MEISFFGKGQGLLRIHAWNMTDVVDAKGYFVLDKHAVVTFALQDVSQISCTDFDMVPGVISDLSITKVDEHFRIEWSASYGVDGVIHAKRIRIALVPGKPDRG